MRLKMRLPLMGIMRDDRSEPDLSEPCPLRLPQDPPSNAVFSNLLSFPNRLARYEVHLVQALGLPFIFPKLQPFKCSTTGLFGQLRSGLSITQHSASNCICHRGPSEEGKTQH